MTRVLVTGGTGFLGAHCLLALLQAGYQTRTTVRNLARETDVRSMLEQGGSGEVGGKLEFVRADLTDDEGWADAMVGCDYVLHVASPFPGALPKHENELIGPARDGTLRVLRAARDAGVKRVVMTSSFAAVAYGGGDGKSTFTEADWTDLEDKTVQPYQKSKAVAERAAWDFVEREGGGLELAAINPVGIFGPVLGPDYSTSIVIVKRLLDGSVPGCPDLWVGGVDVRDVADLHLRAMTDPAAGGERFLASAGAPVRFLDVARILKEHLGEKARKVPSRSLPTWQLRLLGLFKPEVRLVLPELGKRRHASNEKARRVLGWTPRSAEEAVLATARSLLELGVA